MDLTEPVLLVLLTGLFTLGGALGAQFLYSSGAMRAKRIEISFARKADAYREFMIKAATFAHEPWAEASYVEFLHAYLAALLVASPGVEVALKGENGVHTNAQRLRTDRDYISMDAVRGSTWLDAMTRAEAAMRTDLQGLTRT